MDLKAAARAAAALLVLAWAAPTAPLAGQDPFRPPGPLDRSVPTVAALRGAATGTAFSTFRDVERVLEGIAAASPRVRLETYGTSPEGRPLRLAWVSDPAHIARLDSLRAANAARMHGRGAGADGPVFVWLSFGAHGDEASSPEAALELLYQLAASRDATTAEWLSEAVIVIDPLLNPDGHERYVAWHRSVAGPVPDPDPAAREHRPPWPSGRTNHWYFDLNRDWAWGVQPETRARRAAYLATLPHVHVDFHEMDAGSSYFFFPPAAPVHAFYPASTATWSRIFGAANAAAFDARGWAYYTGEEFDLYYPGYGDSWPSFFGATGMTYEQAGGGRAGLVLEREDGTRLTLVDRVLHHLEAARTTIATAVRHRRERLADFDAFWGAAGRRAEGTPAAYLLPATADAEALAELLAAQAVAVDTLAAALATRGLSAYGGTPAADSLPPGTLLLPADQPLGRYLAALMVPGGAPPDTLPFYDISAWSLPFLFGVSAFGADDPPGVPTGRWRGPRPARPAAAGPDTRALVWAYRSTADGLAAARLAGRGFRVRVADRAFSVAGRRWSPGTFVLPVEQPDSLAATADSLARLLAGAGVEAVAVSTFRTDAGVDLGSDHVRLLRPPRVMLAAGPPVREPSLGAGWHLLAAEAGLEVTLVRLADLAVTPGTDPDSVAGRAPLDLEEATVLVLPDGSSAAAYAEVLGEEGAERLRRWVEAGGTLIGIRAGAAYLTAEASGLTDVRLAERPTTSAAFRRAPRARREADDEREKIPGTLVPVTVDTTSPLGYGFPGGTASVLVRDPVELELAERGNAWLYSDQDPRAGYLPASARRRLPGTPYAALIERGRGQIILFGDDPGFRGILHALKRLYLNAVLVVPGAG